MIELEFVETRVFTRLVDAFLLPEEFRALQLALSLRPESGALIRGSRGLRKLRWSTTGRGKRGGLRVIDQFDRSRGRIFLLFLYRKTRAETLTAAQLRELRQMLAEE